MSNFFMLQEVEVYRSRTFRNLKNTKIVCTCRLCTWSYFILEVKFVGPVNECLLSTYYMPGTMLGFEFMVKRRQELYLYRVYHLLGEIDIKEIII